MARVSLAPINTGLYLRGDSESENLRFFAARSGKGVELAMVGNVAVVSDFVPNAVTGVLSNKQCWRDLAEAISANGTTAGIQLSVTAPKYVGNKDFVAHDAIAEYSRYRSIYSGVTESAWLEIERSFVSSIALCKNLGFDHIQIHAAHGYLLSLALDPEIGLRGCGYEVLLSVLEVLRGTSGVAKSLRVSWYTGLPHDLERQSAIIRAWEPFQHDVELDLSNGYYNLDKHIIYPPHGRGEAPYLQNAVELARRFPNASITVAGNIWNPFVLASKTPANLNFAVGRALIADPNHLVRIKSNQSMLCDGCDGCHYYSRGRPSVACPKWQH